MYNADVITKDFPCEKCGCCCRSLAGCGLYADLDRGDGVCRYFDIKSKLCLIYDKRPEKCNISKMYSLYFADQYTWEEFIDVNKKACNLLRFKLQRQENNH